MSLSGICEGIKEESFGASMKEGVMWWSTMAKAFVIFAYVFEFYTEAMDKELRSCLPHPLNKIHFF